VAWAIEDAPQDLGLIYGQFGRRGLEIIRNVASGMGQLVEGLLNDVMAGEDPGPRRGIVHSLDKNRFRTYSGSMP
jgi:hypothetical protein